ncbi:hypothetical protein [Bradyrhizobium sp. JYMT SZCCT0428]|uniref:hypothetical protein n=1 Tax=Bradyrhizobium sp. JYMT SZCCT0428 TaxID=2807673 RepID=UPI001BAE2266|nr:hypothetical protein [Bradyrhizobium sp. JYMT SZCCT0428]MBR1156944.1 hypothetical protein [Bradyrhizobium sp. JYMT SZCCT0428]
MGRKDRIVDGAPTSPAPAICRSHSRRLGANTRRSTDQPLDAALDDTSEWQSNNAKAEEFPKVEAGHPMAHETFEDVVENFLRFMEEAPTFHCSLGYLRRHNLKTNAPGGRSNKSAD